MHGGHKIKRTEFPDRRISINVQTAERSFIQAGKGASIAQVAVIQWQGGRAVSKELREKITAYRTAMAVVKSMLRAGIISEKEYNEIDTIMTEKYGLNSCSIFR